MLDILLFVLGLCIGLWFIKSKTMVMRVASLSCAFVVVGVLIYLGL